MWNIQPPCGTTEVRNVLSFILVYQILEYGDQMFDVKHQKFQFHLLYQVQLSFSPQKGMSS